MAVWYYRVKGLGFRVWGLGLMGLGLRFRVVGFTLSAHVGLGWRGWDPKDLQA